MADNLEQSDNSLLGVAQGLDDVALDALKSSSPDNDEEGSLDGDNKGEDKKEKDTNPPSPDDKGENQRELSDEERTEIEQDLQNVIFGADPTEEDQAVRNDLLEEFGGTSFDSQGNILDVDGNVLVSFNEIVDKLGQEDVAQFDDKGNQIDSEGNIIATKEELTIQNNPVNQVAKKLGYEFKDENGALKVYSEGEAGMAELAEDIAFNKTETFKQEFFNSNPVLREVAKHLLAGKDISDFQKPIDYKSVNVAGLSKESKKNYIRQSFLAEGLSEARAEKIVSGIKDTELDAEVNDALTILDTKEQEKSQQREQDLIAQREQEEAENITYWNTVNETITKGDLGGFNIPDADRKKFFEYLAVPVKEGKSQDMIDRESSPLENTLKEAYYRYKGYDVSSIIKEEVRTNRASSLRNRIKKNQNLSSNNPTKNKGGKAVDLNLRNIR